MAIQLTNRKASNKPPTKKKADGTVFKAKKGSFDAVKEAAAFAAEKKLANKAIR